MARREKRRRDQKLLSRKRLKDAQAVLKLNLGRATSGLRILPDYLIAGVQKGGTTSLYNYLIRHPDVSRAKRKEVHFFDLHYSKGEKWYRSFFPLQVTRDLHERTTKRPLCTGEATPSYLFHPLAPARVAQMLPGAKIIVLLRDPVSRAFSHYHHMRSLGLEELEFEEAIRVESQRLDGALDKLMMDPDNCSRDYLYFSYVSRGFYARQLRRWFMNIDRTRFLILKSEELFSNPTSTLTRVWNFLELEPCQFDNNPIYNKGVYTERLTHSTKEQLYSIYSEDNQELRELTNVYY